MSDSNDELQEQRQQPKPRMIFGHDRRDIMSRVGNNGVMDQDAFFVRSRKPLGLPSSGSSSLNPSDNNESDKEEGEKNSLNKDDSQILKRTRSITPPPPLDSELTERMTERLFRERFQFELPEKGKKFKTNHNSIPKKSLVKLDSSDSDSIEEVQGEVEEKEVEEEEEEELDSELRQILKENNTKSQENQIDEPKVKVTFVLKGNYCAQDVNDQGNINWELLKQTTSVIAFSDTNFQTVHMAYNAHKNALLGTTLELVYLYQGTRVFFHTTAKGLGITKDQEEINIEAYTKNAHLAMEKTRARDVKRGGGGGGGGVEVKEEVKTVKLKIRTRKNQLVKLQIRANATVEYLMKCVAKQLGKNAEELQLYLDGERMENGKTLMEYELEDGDLLDAQESPPTI